MGLPSYIYRWGTQIGHRKHNRMYTAQHASL